MDPRVIGVVGAGAMGAGIAQVALRHGHKVVMGDTNDVAIARGRAAIEKAFQREVEKQRMTDDQAASAMAMLTLADTSRGMDPFAGCQVVIEAIIERLDIKQQSFRALEDVVSDGTILATNTSSLSIASIAGVCDRPERVLGVHFFNPAPVMPLVEIVPGLRTSPAVVAEARGLVDGWGKTTVAAADTPGFIVNRIARPFYSEALRVYDDGEADMATIDWAMREIGGFRMGPFELMDFIGHDVNYLVTESVWTAMYYDPRYKPSLTQKRLLEAGLLGRKSGRGFYDYAEGAAREVPTTDREAGERIFHRVLAMLVNEAADAVHLRIASAPDVELAMTRGVNYPRGLLQWGNAVGPERLLGILEACHAASPDGRYRPSPLLRRCVERQTPLPT
ncbi:MAG: 3-hydroxybutyryl-CoA dehydrogenase [Gemmatimonadetes bacterium]|nr:3-hydroxybutyryl-CoA dehydrogenase [Gemmatimonadota bacterium]